jgi:glucose/arabinose dehydrogenase
VKVEDLPPPFASQSASKSSKTVPRPANGALEVPRGFRVQVFAQGLAQPRWLALAADGAVMVTETRENRIRRLVDADGDGVAEETTTFASAEHGLDIPFGMAFGPEHFFLGNSHEVRRYRIRPGQASLDGKGERIAELPGGGYNQHWTRNVVLDAKNDRLFVSVGSASNASVEEPPRACVMTMGLDGSGARVFASGLRNPVGLALHPESGDLYATVNERDELGDDLVPDYLARVEDGAFYGWPFAYLKPDLLDPRRTASASGPISPPPPAPRRCSSRPTRRRWASPSTPTRPSPSAIGRAPSPASAARGTAAPAPATSWSTSRSRTGDRSATTRISCAGS